MITTLSLTMTGVAAEVPVYITSIPQIRLLVTPSRTRATLKANRTSAKVVSP